MKLPSESEISEDTFSLLKSRYDELVSAFSICEKKVITRQFQSFFNFDEVLKTTNLARRLSVYLSRYIVLSAIVESNSENLVQWSVSHTNRTLAVVTCSNALSIGLDIEECDRRIENPDKMMSKILLKIKGNYLKKHQDQEIEIYSLLKKKYGDHIGFLRYWNMKEAAFKAFSEEDPILLSNIFIQSERTACYLDTQPGVQIFKRVEMHWLDQSQKVILFPELMNNLGDFKKAASVDAANLVGCIAIKQKS